MIVNQLYKSKLFNWLFFSQSWPAHSMSIFPRFKFEPLSQQIEKEAIKWQDEQYYWAVCVWVIYSIILHQLPKWHKLWQTNNYDSVTVLSSWHAFLIFANKKHSLDVSLMNQGRVCHSSVQSVSRLLISQVLSLIQNRRLRAWFPNLVLQLQLSDSVTSWVNE